MIKFEFCWFSEINIPSEGWGVKTANFKTAQAMNQFFFYRPTATKPRLSNSYTPPQDNNIERFYLLSVE